MENSDKPINYLNPEELGSSDDEFIIPSVRSNTDFMKLWIGQTISNIGSFFAFIAIIFFTLRLSNDLDPTRQAQALALVTLIQVIPSFVFGPFSGVLVDRFDRKKIMVIMDIIGAGTSFTMILIAELWQIYALVSFYSIIRVFFYPAKQAALPMIVDPENIMAANSLSQTTMQLSKIIGPALSGFVVAWFGIQMAFIIDGTSFVISAISILFIRSNLKPASATSKLTLKSSLVDLKKGFTIAWENIVIRFAFATMVLFLIAAAMIDPLLAFYLSYQFGLGESAFGLLVSLSAVTGLVTAIIVGSQKNIDRKLLMICSTMLIGGVGVMLIGLAPYIATPQIALFGGMAVLGLVNVMVMIPLSSLIQTIVEEENMGKVNGIMGAILSLTQLGGAAIAGFLVTFLPVNLIYIGSASFLLVAFVGQIGVLHKFGIEQEAQEQQEFMIKVKREKLQQKNGITVPDIIIEGEVENPLLYPENKQPTN